jgi:hypothetical protein
MPTGGLDTTCGGLNALREVNEDDAQTGGDPTWDKQSGLVRLEEGVETRTDEANGWTMSGEVVMVLHGGVVKIHPTWVPQTVNIDFGWDDSNLGSPRPKGRWWSELAFLTPRAASMEGEWEWDASAQHLELWVPDRDVPGFRHLAATLDQFTIPLTAAGASGPGKLAPGLAPVTGPLDLSWESKSTL